MNLQPTEIAQFASNTRVASSSAGELYGAILRDLQNLTQQSGGDPVQVRKTLLLRLQTNGLITSSEQEQLGKISERLSAAPGGMEEADIIAPLRSSYQDMLTQQNSSQTALAIMSILADASVTSMLRSIALSKGGEQPTPGEGVLFASSGTSPYGHVLTGALAGAGAGALAAGPVGSLVGSIIGALAGLLDSILQ